MAVVEPEIRAQNRILKMGNEPASSLIVVPPSEMIAAGSSRSGRARSSPCLLVASEWSSGARWSTAARSIGGECVVVCVFALRKITRSKVEARLLLCTPRVLLALRGLIASRYGVVQVNAVASLVNLSLEKQNKVKIVRSGFVPFLIDVLKGGLDESQEHAAGASGH